MCKVKNISTGLSISMEKQTDDPWSLMKQCRCERKENGGNRKGSHRGVKVTA